MNMHFRWLALPVASALLFAACDRQRETPQPQPHPSASNEIATNAPSASTNTASAAAVKPAFARLAGKWQRTDGDYLVQVKNVDPAGTLDVGYFNPNPIKVSRAAAFEKDNATQVFIELRDVNYPGCTYTLVYDPKTDQLFGQYFQAAMQQTFEVTFERVKE